MKNISKPTGKPTQVTDKTDSDKNPNYAMSVYLKEHEREYIEALADRLGVARHAMLQFGLRYFIEQHRAGEVEIPTETETVTRIQST